MAEKIVVYTPPVFEDIQHEVTKVGNDKDPTHVSLHSDISLLQRIDRVTCSPSQLDAIKERFQNVGIDNPLGEVLAQKSDSELLKACDFTRYRQTLSEQQSYLKELADKTKSEQVEAEKAKAAEETKAKEDEEAKKWSEFVERLNNM